MWHIVCTPEGYFPANDDEEGEDENRSHVKVVLVNEGARQTVCCVGFARRNTKHPDVNFREQLQHSTDDARAAVNILNERLAPQDGLV